MVMWFVFSLRLLIQFLTCLGVLAFSGCMMHFNINDLNNETPVSAPPTTELPADPSPSIDPNISLTSVNPTTGSTSGGYTLTLTGTNFLAGASVTIDNVSCGSVSILSSTQLTCLMPASMAKVASITVTNTLLAQPSGTRTASLATGFTYVAPTLFDLYFGSQTMSSSLILKLKFHSDSNTTTLDTTNNITGTLGTNGIRALIDLVSGGLLIGGSHSANNFWNATLGDPLSLGSSHSLSGRGSGELTDFLGGCVLPNGNIIAGGYYSQFAAEYSSAGSYLRDLPVLSYYLSDCVAKADGTTLFVSDYDADTDEAGFIRKLTFNSSSWVVDSSLNVTTFAGMSKGSPYSLVLNTDGNLYIPPQNPSPAGGVRKLIRCLNADLSNCQEIGANWPVNYPGGAVEGAVQIPGSYDMLFIDNTHIYRYRVADDTMTSVYDLNILGHDWTRNMRIRIP